MIFITNKYTKYYFSIINNATQQNRKKLKKLDPTYIYYEKHHIIPKCLSGSNDKTNLVVLTAREHFICHWLLTKMTLGDARAKMIYALNGMKRNSNGQNRYKTLITSRVYEQLKIQFSKINPFNDLSWQKEHRRIGYTQSDKTKEKLKAAWTLERKIQARNRQVGVNHGPSPFKGKLRPELSGENNGFFGKTHSAESKAKISAAMKGTIWTKILISCIYCKDCFASGNFTKYHGEKCKAKAGLTPANYRIYNNRVRKIKQKQISIYGIIYESLTSASISIGVKLCTLSYRANSVNFTDIFYLQDDGPLPRRISAFP